MMRVEATYLVNELPKDLGKYKSDAIEQGYLVEDDDACRIRKKGDEYTITHKLIPIKGDLSFREYISVPLLRKEFEKLWRIVIKKLKKTRYYQNEMGSNYELRIDVFEGNLKGLILAELIFADETAERDFSVPSWFGPKVTNEPWMSNQFLAGHQYGQVKALIEKMPNK